MTEKITKPASKSKSHAVAQGYVYAVGRRKSAVARVRLYKKGEPRLVINGKPLHEVFVNSYWQGMVEAPLQVVDAAGKFYISVKVEGGGLRGQAESIRHGIARVLQLFNPEWRTLLKRAGFLKRDPRVKERKKYGLKRARRAPQWSKR
ncbi:MAG: 30S ribosomal protein S9 [Candidatus Kerfeldbacteria bacterium RIFCSPHIGHO2_12_FULL_48_17]|uniref:Small ribosomal subunit protein uS9 n=1 Tax=Candidatus Kerfeldbacteria bacterium RIFCSPHIGHO2_12_FULL_48_17 TaxID=1798542 RepID=A0A1G2AXS4_9BACT|nr:MAG: 30S ribosomal protein S9 [Candidatus Kerfeldbacteria bacterium RIFCSPHIGHO2_12_FULL_48_17]